VTQRGTEPNPYSTRECAESYDAARFSTPAGRLVDEIEREIVRAQAPRVYEGARAADIGTGTGRFAVELGRLGFFVVASDVSGPMLDVTARSARREASSSLSLVRGDVYSLPFVAASFDYVVCVHVLNQLRDADSQEKALRELCRVCRPGGRVMFDVYNRHSAALLAPASKKGLYTLHQITGWISDIDNMRIESVTTRLLVPRTALGIIPSKLLSGAARVDRSLSEVAPQFATKAYISLSKLRPSPKQQ